MCYLLPLPVHSLDINVKNSDKSYPIYCIYCNPFQYTLIIPKVSSSTECEKVVSDLGFGGGFHQAIMTSLKLALTWQKSDHT